MSGYTQLRKTYRTLKSWLANAKLKRGFKKQFREFNALNTAKRFENLWENTLPCLHDNTSLTGFDAHYIYHPAWATRVLKSTKPEKHIDISSTLHFCTTLSAFIETEFYDYRPANITLDGLTMGKADLTNLHFEDGSLKSVSCMHTIEHIGLGRYGDPIEPDGDLRAITELKRVCCGKRGSINCAAGWQKETYVQCAQDI